MCHFIVRTPDRFTILTVMDTNFHGNVAMTKAFLPLIRASRGRIININSISGIVGTGGYSAYSASKFALEGFNDSIRKELRLLGVAVISVHPGYIQTPLGNKIIDSISVNTSSEDRALYGKYINNAVGRHYGYFKRAPQPSESTTGVIIQALTDPRPQAHYYVSRVYGLDASMISFFFQLLPTYLFDVLSELPLDMLKDYV